MTNNNQQPTTKDQKPITNDQRPNFPALEEEILAFWKKEKIFEKSVTQRNPQKTFRFFDGPPFATGLPHYGHILQGVIKDLIPRFFTMRGYRVPRQWGWDCHGLPVENLIEKELGLTEPGAIAKFGIAKFNEACRASVLKFAKEWEKTVHRMGRFIDFENSYKTMDPEFMDKVWQVFHALWQKNLVYAGLKPMHICPRCATPLSNFEVGLNYQDTTDLSAIVKFALVNEPKTFFLAWTTTPWTLPGNTALAVNPAETYVKVQIAEHNFILAEQLLKQNFPEQKLQIVAKFPGQKLIGQKYQPLFPYFAEDKNSANAFQIYPADFVNLEDGTGIVHIAPAFGEDDYNLAQKFELPIWKTVDLTGRFLAVVTKFAREEVKPLKNPRATDEKICKFLQDENKIFSTENLRHSYPFCWRCESPLLNYATKSFFIAVTKIKAELLKNNEKINWQPPHIREGRFGKWLAGARDWAVSRNRFWGTPLPVWICQQCQHQKCLNSRAELEKLSAQKIPDLHKHFVDEIQLTCEKCQGTMTRTPEVFDCWFESGSMPFSMQPSAISSQPSAANKLATSNQQLATRTADFIAEAQDQTRGWFYTLHVLATALNQQPAFKNCVCSGLILAENGQKMSKSKRNFPDPAEIFTKYGADAMRFYLLNSPVVNASELRFSEQGVAETLRAILLPFWHTFYFFVTYAQADNYVPDPQKQTKSTNQLDRFILSELNALIKVMTANLEKFAIQKAISPLAQFLDTLTNWYVRRSRRRFWKTANDADKLAAYATLFEILTKTAQLLAPSCPFLAEKIWRSLTKGLSVHLSSWPEFDPTQIDAKLNQHTAILRKIISLGLSLRAKQKIKIRQPLQNVLISTPETLKTADCQIIQEELNVKEVKISLNPAEIATKFVRVQARLVGKRLGAKVQKIIAAAKQKQVKFLPNETVEICGEILRPPEIEIIWQGQASSEVASEGGLVVALNLAITPELKLEGRARDLNRQIQDLRKKIGLAVSDRIELQLTGAADILAQAELKNWLQQETLATKIVEQVSVPDFVEWEGLKIGIKKLVVDS